MKVVMADVNDKPDIYRLWKQAFSHDDGGYTDHYFKSLYDQADTYLLRDEQEIYCTLQVQKHVMMLHGKLIEYGFIMGVVTPPQFRRQGMMRKLMNEVLAILDRQCLVSVIQGYQPEIYYEYGFMPTYYQQQLRLERSKQSGRDSKGVVFGYQPQLMAELYQAFTQHFNGYRQRDILYYQQWLPSLQAMGYQVALCYSDSEMVIGYMVYKVLDHLLAIEEIIYINAPTLRRLVNFGFSIAEQVQLKVSVAEHIERLFVVSEQQIIMSTMVRINDYHLFNELYGRQVSEVSEAMAAEKPLYFNEYE
jgi:predicted acetyltransferase